ncbi:MAG: hypothetical protein ACO2PN_09955 [Pyrobaculum sp.]|jgi:hypothetical protein
MDIEKVEKLLHVKIVSTETIKGKVFPLFDLIEIEGLKLALIENPTFVVIDKDVYEKRAGGAYVVVQKDDETYLLMKYTGDPNVERLRAGAENPNEEAEQEEDEDRRQETEEEVVKEGGEEQGRNENNPVKEILSKLPKWADGAVIIEREGGIVAFPIKKSKRKDGSYYAATSWRPLDISGRIDNLVDHAITRNGKVNKVNVHANDKYINIFIRNVTSNRKNYSRRR